MFDVTKINLSDDKYLILQLLCMIIGTKIYKYDFFSTHTNLFVLKLIYNGLLIGLVSLLFLTYSYNFFDKLQLNGITQVFVSYWISIVITDNIYKKNDVLELNKIDRTVNLTKEIALNIIVFSGLVTIFNLHLLQKDSTHNI